MAGVGRGTCGKCFSPSETFAFEEKKKGGKSRNMERRKNSLAFFFFLQVQSSLTLLLAMFRDANCISHCELLIILARIVSL